jgi:hypothetical protein
VRGAVIVVALVSGCSFSARNAEIVDARSDTSSGGDGSDLGPPPLHLGSGDGDPGTAPWTITGTVMIDTTSLTITGAALPAGDTFDARPQLGSGPELAVLHVGTLAIASGAIVTVTGSRPFVIVAGGDVTIDGTLDAGGHRAVGGPGAQGSGAMGDGVIGGYGENASNSGGGGGGYGGAGASGGAITGCSAPLPGGSGGSAWGDATISELIGGTPGGASSGTQCPLDPGGAGGGALQITSATQITITGKVLAGGGGGTGGSDCGQADVNSGPGGGSGGAIVLQAPMIQNTGVVAANGGGGGGSSSTGNGNANPGQDGQPSATPAMGGTGPTAKGGAGAAGTTPPTAGGSSGCGTNGAGGGGGVGRIAASAGYTSTGTTSPPANTTLPP